VAVIKVSRFWPSQRSVSVASGSPASQLSDGLDAFNSETAVPPAPPPPAPPPAAPSEAEPEQTEVATTFKLHTIHLTMWVALAVTIIGAAVAGIWQYQRRSSGATVGSLVIDTLPAGATVSIGGVVSGQTPLRTSLRAGAYDVQVSANGQRRDLRVTITAGASVFHQIEFAAAAPAVAATGSLSIQTDLRQAVVFVDGVERGRAPLTVADLGVGDHQVLVKGDTSTFRRTVPIKAQETLSLMISSSESTAALPGYLTVSSPVVMQLRSEGRLIGTTETERLMMPAGDREIEISSEPLGYRTTRKLSIAPGKLTTSVVDLPAGVLNINALPWAEVWIDGERIGETPLANLSRRIGSHQIVFKHPQLGERSETVLVTLRQPVRLGIDMRRQ
jgi:hypothetical protein